MQALILAAGFGTRLLPLTKNIPKAMIEIKNKPLIYYIIQKLMIYGFDHILVNSHYQSDKLNVYLNKIKKEFPIKLELIYEKNILDTGGAIKNIEKKIIDDNFLVYNVDILSAIDIKKFIQYHQENHALVTLAVNKRITKSYFLVDKNKSIIGLKTNTKVWNYQNSSKYQDEYGFCGIHLINRSIFKYMEHGKFSIITKYLELLKNKHTIKAYIFNDYWIDAGKLDTLKKAENDYEKWKVF